MGNQAAKLRELIKRPGCTASVGVWNALTAKIAEKEGIELVFLESSGVSLSLLGKPDLGYITQTEMVEQTRRVTNVVSLPCIVDCEDGYGTPLNIQRTVQLFEQTGAGGLFFEDLAFPKRSALWLTGGGLVSRDWMVRKIKAAVKARSDPDLVIIARTDPYEGLAEAISRGNAYAEAGADMVFVAGLKTVEDIQRVCKETRVPVMQTRAYALADGTVPSLAEYDEMGVKFIIYPSLGFLTSQNALRNAMREFKKTLVDRTKSPNLGPPFTEYEELEAMLGLEEDIRLALGKEYPT